jgi:hypothetical protein
MWNFDLQSERRTTSIQVDEDDEAQARNTSKAIVSISGVCLP